MNTKRHCKLVLIPLLASCASLHSSPKNLPTGGEVVAGDATISETNANLKITQNSDQAILNWDSFAIGENASVHFDQPSETATALNRILGDDVSNIFGSLTADGQIFLLNPNGVYFGRDSQVDTGGLVATTMRLSDESFLNRDYTFLSSGTGTGILNQGYINADGSYVGLFADRVSNEGIISARLGSVAMASGQKLTYTLDGTRALSIAIDEESLIDLAASGNIVRGNTDNVLMTKAASQHLLESVIPTNSIQASGFVKSADGSIRLVANTGSIQAQNIAIDANSGNANIGGHLDTGSSDSIGGNITITGQGVKIEDRALLDASGTLGGGSIRIGGDFQGKNTHLRNATQTTVSDAAKIDASAQNQGNGGRVIVWADDYTDFQGNINAQGGALAGNGGFVEVSGKENLNFNGFVNASALYGESGTLLLDPKTIIIQDLGGDAFASNNEFTENPTADATIAPSSITATTNTGTGVTLQANNDITVNSPLITNNTGGNGGSLTFQAGRSITNNALINSDNATINFIINDDNADAGNRDAGDANFISYGLIDAGTATINITVDDTASNDDVTINTGNITTTGLVIDHNEAAATSAITLSAITALSDVTITADGAVDVLNTTPDGTLRVIGTTKITTGGDVSITGTSTDLETVGITANNVDIFDKKALVLGASGMTSTISGDLNLDIVGPIGNGGVISVTGNTAITASNGGFGVSEPEINLNDYANDFNQVTVTQGSSGSTFTIKDADDLQLIATTIQEYATVTTGGDLDIEGSFGSDLTITSAGAIRDSAAMSVPDELTLGAGAGADITLNDPGNDFYRVDIQSGRNATLVNGVAGTTDFYDGSSTAVDITGNLDVTSNGSIQQTYYNHSSNTTYGNYSKILVDGNASFTVTAANSNLFLGPQTSSYYGQNNDIGGDVTVATSDSGTYTDVYLRNISATAENIIGLNTVGTLDDVTIVYDSAANIDLPGMSVNGNLYVKNGTGSITQSGAIIVDNTVTSSKGITTLWTPSNKDITLTNTANDFHQIKVEQGDNVSLVDTDEIELYANVTSGYYDFRAYGDLTVSAGGNITDQTDHSASEIIVAGLAKLTARSGTPGSYTYHDITLDNVDNQWNQLQIVAADDASIYTTSNIQWLTSDIESTLYVDAEGAESMTQVADSTLTTGGNTTFRDFGNITFTEADNSFGDLYLYTPYSGTTSLREDNAITQSQSWYTPNQPINLTTSNDQAITLDQTGNYFSNITITQINDGEVTPGSVLVRENYALTQGGAWTTHGNTHIDSRGNSITMTNSGNVLGPLKVEGGNTAIFENDTIEDYADWTTGYTQLSAFASGIQGDGNIVLDSSGNVLGNLIIESNDVTIVENDNITDWSTWTATGDVVLNPGSHYIDLDITTNVLGPIDIDGTPSSVEIHENDTITQAGPWAIGAAPVTVSSRTNAIDLTETGNVLGAISILVGNGTPNSVSIKEDDAITQGGTEWLLAGKAVTLVTENEQAITLNDADNIMGDLTLTGGATSIRENDNITDGSAWTTTGTTTLNPGTTEATSIVLNNTGNVLGDIAISGIPSAVTIVENDDITQASAWSLEDKPVTITTVASDVGNVGGNDIILSQAANILGDLTLTAPTIRDDVTVTEADAIADGSAWTVGGTALLTAKSGGTLKDIVLDSNGPAGTVGTLRIAEANDVGALLDVDTLQVDSAVNVTLTDSDAVDLNTSTVDELLKIDADGHITQTGGTITSTDLLLVGSGYATLEDANNDVENLAAGFTGGDLSFTNDGTFSVATVDGTVGIGINANDVTLRSENGTVSSVSNISSISSSLDINTGTALSLPNMIIAGPQDYTAGGNGITLESSIQSTATGAIRFHSNVTVDNDLSILTEDSAIVFDGTIDGSGNILTTNAGSSIITFTGAVSNLGAPGDAQTSLNLTAGGTGSTFTSTLDTHNGITVTGPVVFRDDVTLGDGSAGSVFAGQVTLGKVGGMDLAGYDTMRFSGGILLENGPATINSNNSLLTFEGSNTLSGPFALELNSGTAEIIGLDHIGTNITELTVTADEPVIPAAGISIAGPQTYTATGGTDITLKGNVTSTSTGAITFNNPVTVDATVAVSSTNSEIIFESTVDGPNDLTINSGTAATRFKGLIGDIAELGDGTGAALTLEGTGNTIFSQTVATNSGVIATGPVTFTNDVTLEDGDTGSTFTGLVTTDGIELSGFDGWTFNGGLTQNDDTSILGNGADISFAGPVSGAYKLLLNALANDAGTVTGLNNIDTGLTALTIIGHTLSLPNGLAVSGLMDFTAEGGITLNGALGGAAAPAGGRIDLRGPVTLAANSSVTTSDSYINFTNTVDGAFDLTVTPGSATTTFSGAIGGDTALTSLTAVGDSSLGGASIETTGLQRFDSVTLTDDSVHTGSTVEFLDTLDGEHNLTVNATTTLFQGEVGQNTALASITTNAAGTTTLDTTAIDTVGNQNYQDAVTLAENITLSGDDLSFRSTVNGNKRLTVSSADGTARFEGAVGGTAALREVDVTASDIELAANITTAPGVDTGVDPGDITLDGPTTIESDLTLSTGGGVSGDITFSGTTSTINGANDLTLEAGQGDVRLDGQVGNITPLSNLAVSGKDLYIPLVQTNPLANQSYDALNNITLTQSRTVNAPLSFAADSDLSGAGAFILQDGVTLTATNNALNITAADIDLQGSSTMASGSGLITVTASADGSIGLGDGAGQLTISGDELSRISSSGGLKIVTTGTGNIEVDNVTEANSQNISGLTTLNTQGTGDVVLTGTASTFNALTLNAAGGTIQVGANLNTTNNDITFQTPTSVSGASTINSGGGAIDFQDTIAVDNPFELTTNNGVLTLGDSVTSNSTLVMNLGGGSVVGLDQLQANLTGLTVNSSSDITLPAIAIEGPMVFNTGLISANGDLSAIGLSFGNVAQANADDLEFSSRTGTLNFSNLLGVGSNDLTLTGDEINLQGATSGTGDLLVRPHTNSQNISMGGTASTAALDLSETDLANLRSNWSLLTIGRNIGTGTLDLKDDIDLAAIPVALNGAAGISQSSGDLTATGPVALWSDSGSIVLDGAGNDLGALAITGTPTAVAITDTTDITQSAAWSLGTAPVTLDAGINDILLTQSTNEFGTLALTGSTVSVNEAAATDLGASTADTLTVTSTGAISTSATVAVSGSANFETRNDAGADITIENASVFARVDTASKTADGSTLASGDMHLAPGGSTLLGILETIGNITLTAAVSDTLSQFDPSKITAAGLELLGLGSHSLGNGTNDVDTLAANTATVEYTDSDGFAIGTVNTTGFTASGNATLSTTGSVTQTELLAANSLSLLGTGADYTLNHGSNAISNLAANTGDLSFLENSGFAIASVNGTDGIALTGDLSLSSSGTVTQSETIKANGIELLGASGNYVLDTSDNDVDTVAANTGTIDLRDDDGFVIGTVNTAGVTTNGNTTFTSTDSVTQSSALDADGLELLGVGANYVLDHADNTTSTLAANTGDIELNNDTALEIGTVNTAGVTTTGDLTITNDAAITQTQAMLVGGNLSLTTTHAAGDVELTHTVPDDTVLADVNIGGDFTLTATGKAISQANGTSVRVANDLTIDGASLVLDQVGNLIGGTTSTPSTAELRQAGVITLGNVSEAANYTVVSEATNRTFDAPIHGVAMTLNNTRNAVAGTIELITDTPAINAGADVKTGINQTPGTTIDIAGVATFIAESSSVPDSGIIDLSNTGNTFGSLVLNGSIVTLLEDTGTTAIRSANATSLDLTSAGEITQIDQIVATTLSVNSGANITLDNAANNVSEITANAVTGINYADADDLTASSITSTGAASMIEITAGDNLSLGAITSNSGTVALTATTGSITQTGIISEASSLTANAGTAVTLDGANTLANIGDITASTGIEINDQTNGLTIDADLNNASGDILIHTEGGDLTLADTRTIEITGTGDISLIAGANQNFVNQSTAGTAPLVLNDGRYLIYSHNHTQSTTLGNLNETGYMGFDFANNAPASIAGTNNRILYKTQATLTFDADDKSRSYGDANPALTYSVTGYLTGDNAASSFTSDPVLSTAAVSTDPVNDYAISIIQGGTLASDRGYLFDFTNGNLAITPRPVNATGNRAYDGTDVFNASGLNISNLVFGETLGFTGTSDSSSANAGVHTLDLSGMTLSDGTGSASNYSFAGGISTATISPYVVDLDGQRVYDGSTNANAADLNIQTLIGSETLTLSGTGTAASSNVGTRPVNETGLSLVDGTGLAANYTLAGGTHAIDITPYAVDLDGQRIYDGTTTLAASDLNLSALIGTETLTLSGVGSVASANVSNNTAVTLGTLALSDGTGLASNYTLSSGTHTADITPYTVDITGTRIYDATTDADASNLSLGALIGAETLSLSGNGTTNSRHVGSRSVDTAGLTLNDGTGLASNYSFTGGSHTLEITQAPLALTTNNVSKTYDGNTTANGSLMATSGTNLLGADTLSGGTFTYSDKNAGTNKTISVSGVTVNDDNSGANYSVSYVDNTTSEITQRILDLNSSRIYNATTIVNASDLSLNNLVTGETLATNGDLTMNDKHVGTGKAISNVAITLADNTGDASNYTLSGGDVTVDITQAAISLTASDIVKTYDATTDATGSLQATGGTSLLGSDTMSGGHFAYTDANAANGTKTVTTSAATLSDGNNGANYAITYVDNTTSTINKKALNLAAIADDKVYDATTAATINDYGISGLVGNQTILVSSNGSVSFADKNAGTDKTVTATDLIIQDGTNGGIASNYSIANSTTSTADITPRSTTLSGITASDKTYDARTDATIETASSAFSGLIAGDTLTVNSTGLFSDKNAGSNKTVNLSNTFGGSDLNNYAITDQSSTTANISRATLNISASGHDKVYDSTTNATATLSGDTIADDTVTYAFTDANFADKNVGSEKSISISGISISGDDANNYDFSTSATSTADITKAPLFVSGITAADRVYDTTTAVTVDDTGANYTGLFTGDYIDVNATGIFANKNAEADKTVTLTSNYIGNDVSNYNITGQSTTTATITPAQLNVFGVFAEDKIYDGTTVATINTKVANLVGALGNDDVDVSTITGIFARKNIGTNIEITGSEFELSGNDAVNYTIIQPVGLTASIAKRQLTVTATGQDKTYDGTTNATVVLNDDRVAGDLISIDSIASFYDPNAGTSKFVSVRDISLSGDDALNYYVNLTARAFATINKANIIVSGITALSKIYDGTAFATVDTSKVNFAGLLDGDELSITSTGAFSDKNAGSDKNVTLSSNYGGDLVNYQISEQNQTTADIYKKVITVAGITANDKAYDSNDVATADLSNIVFNGMIQGDSLRAIATGAFSDKTVGTSKAVNLTTDYNGTDLNNYEIIDQDGTTATITQRQIVINGITVQDKMYDATVNATTETSNAILSGFISGDDLSITAKGAFSDKDAGEDKTVYLSYSYGGNDMTNYAIAPQETATATILPNPELERFEKSPSSQSDLVVNDIADATTDSARAFVGVPNNQIALQQPSQQKFAALSLPASTSVMLAPPLENTLNLDSNGNGFTRVRSFATVALPAQNAFGWQLPRNTFSHGNPDEKITYEARLANGEALPAWLTFDPETQTFTGQTKRAQENLEIAIIASDEQGAEAISNVTIRFRAKWKSAIAARQK